MSQFSQPAEATGGIEWGPLNGALLIIQPTEIVKDIQTVHGLRDAVRATITVVDGTTAGEVHEDTLVFPKVLVSQLKSRIGQNVLGRLGQGAAKPGQKPPWTLNPGSSQDEQAALAVLTPKLTAADI
jgi:hypothetical protein